MLLSARRRVKMHWTFNGPWLAPHHDAERDDLSISFDICLKSCQLITQAGFQRFFVVAILTCVYAWIGDIGRPSLVMEHSHIGRLVFGLWIGRLRAEAVWLQRVLNAQNVGLCGFKNMSNLARCTLCLPCVPLYRKTL